MKEGRIYCERFDQCHALKLCLCEVELCEDSSLPPPRRLRIKHTPWAVRRQQVLDLAGTYKVISTATLMEITGATKTTVALWLRTLASCGDLVRLTPAAPLEPATFAIKGD